MASSTHETTDAAAAASPQDDVTVQVEDAPMVEDPAAMIEVTLLVPHQSFIRLAGDDAAPKKTEFLELPIPIALTDAVHELRQLIVESPEGFWLGAFGLVPVVAELVGEVKEGEEAVWGPWTDIPQPAVDAKEGPLDPKIWRLTNEGVLGDFADLAPVFGGDEFEGKKRGLKVVVTSFSHLAMSLHLIRLRDTLYLNLPAVSNRASYDPTSIAIGSGSTVYASVRGDTPVVEVVEESADVKGKKGKSTKKESTPATAPAAEPAHPFVNFSIEDLNPYTAFEHLHPAASPSLATPCFKAFGVSPWSPPPHARRMRGDIIYLTVTTLEGDSFHITGSTSGFWISKMTSHSFDPLPKAVQPAGLRHTPYHSLFELFSALSPGFVKGLSKLIESQNSAPASADIYASLAIMNAIPAAPWLIPAPVHTSDPFRTQIAFLLTSTTNADLLPPARDWNDELAQYKELPQKTLPEKLVRERLLHRVNADFVNAATRGALSIARGDVPPLNPNEPQEAHTYIYNQMLFTRADDAINAWEHAGGNEASRVAASKDLAGVNILERLDIGGIHTMATAIIDYCGDRWVAQSLIPGLFKTKELDEEVKKGEVEETDVVVYPAGDAEAIKTAAEALANDKPFPSDATVNKDDYPPTGVFRIVYGSSNPEAPDENIRSSSYFHQIAGKVAQEVKLAEHTVVASDGKSTSLWTSTDMHGIAAPDGRSYFIDCFRLHCVDVEFLENNISGTPFADAADVSTNGVHTPLDYPHRLVLLRPELLELYRDSKLQVWIEERVLEAREKIAAAAALEPAAGSVELELKDAATDNTTTPESVQKAPPAIINAADYHLSFNPDAFIERKPLASGAAAPLIYDVDADSTKSVRDASVWLRTVALPEFIFDVVTVGLVFTDGLFLTKLLHRKGINMRYIGMLASMVETDGPTTDFGAETRKEDNTFALAAFKKTLQHEMVSRSSKHILNKLLRDASTYDHPSVIAHFCNCLLGTSLESHPLAELVDLPHGVSARRSWTSLTPSSLRAQLVSEVESRFRYALPVAFFDTVVPTKLLREICARVGIQLVLRNYNFGSSSSTVAVVSSSDEATKAEVSSETKTKKKKSSSKSKKEVEVVERQLLSIRPEDVLNIVPVVKTTVHKSALVDDNYTAGIRALSEPDGNAEFGQDLINDSLHLCEQIFGTVHSEAATKYHNLGLMYHSVSTKLQRSASLSDSATQAMADMPEEGRAEAMKRFESLLIADTDAVRAEADHYLQTAVRMVRQSVIIAERTFGLDATDTIQQYTDLGLLEQSIGNSRTGLLLTKHALFLWATAYGPHHPSTLNLLTNASSMIQTKYGIQASIPTIIECTKLAKLIYGTDSVPFAAAVSNLSQAYGLIGDLGNALVYSADAHATMLSLLGAEAKETIDAAQFMKAVKDAIENDIVERQAKEANLRSKFPRLAADKEGRAIADKVEEAVIVKKEHGQKANLSVDELVNFIQGTPAKAGMGKKRKGSPKASS